MKKLRRSFWILLMILLVLVTACQPTGRDPVRLIEAESTFQDFRIVGEEVQVRCLLTLRNTSSEDVRLRISAWMPEDADNGLLKSADLPGISLDRSESNFLIRANSTAICEVLFVGEFGGVAVKQDRRLPEIRWDVISRESPSGD